MRIGKKRRKEICLYQELVWVRKYVGHFHIYYFI